MPRVESRGWVTDAQGGFAGGLNSVADESAVGATQVRRAENARLTAVGGITKRGGTRRTTTAVLAAAPVETLFPWRKDDGSVDVLATCNGALRVATPGTFPWTFSSPAGTLGTIRCGVAAFRTASGDAAFIADGGPLNHWDGTTLTTNVASTPSCTVLAAHNRRLYGAGDASFPVGLFYSGLNAGETLGVGASGGGQINVRTFGEQRITALLSLGASLLVFHPTGISRLTGYGEDDIVTVPVGLTADVGTVAPQSVVSDGAVAYFVSDKGVYAATEATVQALDRPDTPDPVRPLLARLTAAERAAITCTLHRPTRELWVWVPGIGTYVYALTLGAWSGPWTGGWTADQTTVMADAVDSTGAAITLRGTTAGWVEVCDTGVRDQRASGDTGGSLIAMSVRLRRLFSGDPAGVVAHRFAYVLANLAGSTSASVSYTTADAAGTKPLAVANAGGTWGVGTWGSGLWGGVGARTYRVPTAGRGTYLDLTLVDDGAGVPTFSRVDVEGVRYGRRGE